MAAILPLLAAGISATFSAILVRRFARSRRVPALAWSVALAMFAIASVAVALGVTGGWDAPLFRVYWLLGAMLNVPWLALGSVALLGDRKVTAIAFALVAAASLFGAVRVADANIRPAALARAGTEIPAGKDVLCDTGGGVIRNCDPTRRLAIWYSTPAWLVVIGVAAGTALFGDRRGSRDRARANWIISLGVTIVAVGSTALVRLGHGSAFSVTLAVGIAVMFAGFLMASRPPPASS